ncbi:hypothetical protein PG993_012004 [Apiospora rasikravindrae]|uniref:Uncharacterized protein n=1 Tax=Apiospora rasikravindrae TaxID=990691 RepID=A0ABR1S1E2_9PEZI
MDDGDTGHVSNLEKTLSELFGHGRTQHPSPHGVKVARGTLTNYPESLRLEHREESDSILPPVDLEKAIANAKAQDDAETIFFVNFPEQLEGNSQKTQKELIDSVLAWKAWASTMVERKVQEQVDAGKFSPDSVARGTYRAKVFDYLMRQSTWCVSMCIQGVLWYDALLTVSSIARFWKTFDQNMSKHIAVKKVELHAEILTTVLQGFSVPASVYGNLEKVLREISDGIVKTKTDDSQQYWIMLTKYNWDPFTESSHAGSDSGCPVPGIAASPRIYPGQVEIRVGLVRLEFGQYQADFNADIFAKIRPSIDEKHIDLGIELVQKRTTDVSIPAP